MIYANRAINCDVSIRKDEYGFHFCVVGNVSKTQFVVPTLKEAINECLWLRTLGVDIPDFVIEKLRSEDV